MKTYFCFSSQLLQEHVVSKFKDNFCKMCSNCIRSGLAVVFILTAISCSKSGKCIYNTNFVIILNVIIHKIWNEFKKKKFRFWCKQSSLTHSSHRLRQENTLEFIEHVVHLVFLKNYFDNNLNHYCSELKHNIVLVGVVEQLFAICC